MLLPSVSVLLFCIAALGLAQLLLVLIVSLLLLARLKDFLRRADAFLRLIRAETRLLPAERTELWGGR